MAKFRAASPGDATWMARVAAESFYHDPLWEYLVLPQRRRAVLTEFYTSYLEARIGSDDVLVADGLAWILWERPGRTESESLSLRDLTSALRVFRVRTVRAIAVQAALSRARAQIDPAHYFLDVVAVAPEAQGRGLGTQLVRDGIERANQLGVACYLEATGSRNEQLYRRLGFRSRTPLRFGATLALIPMLRTRDD